MRRCWQMVFPVLLLFGGSARAEGWQIFPEAVFYNADALRASTAGGLAINYNFHKYWGAAAEIYLGQVAHDGRFSPKVDEGDLFLAGNLALIFNTPAHFGAEGDPWRAEIYTSAGPTFFRFGKAKCWGGFIGGGMNIYTRWPWLAIRFDLKNFFYDLSNPQGNGFNSDLSFALGPLFQF